MNNIFNTESIINEAFGNKVELFLSVTSTFHPYQAEHIAEPLCLAMIEHVGIWV